MPSLPCKYAPYIFGLDVAWRKRTHTSMIHGQVLGTRYIQDEAQATPVKRNWFDLTRLCAGLAVISPYISMPITPSIRQMLPCGTENFYRNESQRQVASLDIVHYTIYAEAKLEQVCQLRKCEQLWIPKYDHPQQTYAITTC